jgi:CheY-like chemotaxis protein
MSRQTQRSLLVVDDEPSMRMLLDVVLRRQGWLVEGRESGEEALAALERQGFDVLLIDRCLPGMSGIELARAVRQLGAMSGLVVATGLASFELARDLLPFGVSALLDKPFADMGELAAALAAALRERDRRLRGPLAAIAANATRPRLAVLSSSREDAAWAAASLDVAASDLSLSASLADVLSVVEQGATPLCLVDEACVVGPVADAVALLREVSPATSVVVVGTRPDLPVARALMIAGARGLVERPLDGGQSPSLREALRYLWPTRAVKLR